MTARKINPDGWPEPRGYSNGILAEGRVLAIGGQVGWTSEQVFEAKDFVGQFDQTLANVRAILDAATGGAPFDVAVPDIDEKAIGDRLRDDPVDLVRQIALAKADELEAQLKDSHPDAVLLTGDQVVTYEGAIREKPASQGEARASWTRPWLFG